ncbi:uncharacterized protein K460DRAFT_334845 [Cucurbitaria berberidis CBS 394.84]|uniref:Uncharacterized protein n=1 Tax=Cucurbitaria berberidis CBS 394.84 TaxID=1168544 RepID=A0A9P4LAN6_9PLEO|nr:uncharacterized protein K460DRAFT_334845 [Cucurbitaria berberidis CBS 394.84]KAF1848571.1 hypothetical protein K460DRAFT_334845 [Cucurbitaria berberidis CBS 394.84]
MSTISNMHLFFLVLAAVPSSFSGVMIKNGGVASVSAAVSLASPVSLESASTLLGSGQTQSSGSPEDIGSQYGNVTVRNNCPEPLYLWSIGAWKLQGFRNTTVGYGAKEEEVMHTIPSGEKHTEQYRVTCPPAKNGTEGYCWDHDKLRGQGVAIKISNNQSLAGDISQFEYALIQNPLDNTTYHKLNYDVSLLDCAKVATYAGFYGLDLADSNHRIITDASSSDQDHTLKVEKCPGYNTGLALTFPSDKSGERCKPIHCDGKKKCQVYYFDWTRNGEPSMACTAAYKGDMVLDLCIGSKKADGK